MKNIVTGASGFLGSHLIKKLEGDTLIIPHEKIQTIEIPPFEKGFFLSTYGNLAHHDDDNKIFQANILDLIHVLQKVIHYDFKSFVFMSTSSVKLRIQTMYSRTKKAAEEILLAILEKYRKPICVIRPYSIFGKKDRTQHLIPTLIRSCFEGESVDFVPSPVHDWIAVDDVVDGILNLSSHSARGIYELGTGHAISNKEVLETIEKITGKKANVHIVNRLRNYDTTLWVSTNFRSRGFGWLPKRNFKDVIEEIVEDYLQNPSIYGKVEQ